MGDRATQADGPGRAAPVDPAGAGLAWLAHPATIVATIVLILNDHILKPAWPGLVTGKLSDVAGLVLAPALLGAVALIAAPRLPAVAKGGLARSPAVAKGRPARSPVQAVAVMAIAVTGLGFTVVKTTDAGAAAASAIWTVLSGPSLVQRDPTDLVALPVLALAWLSWRQARVRPASARLVRLLRVGVLLPISLLAVAATSQVRYASADRVATTAEGFVLDIDSGFPPMLASPDGLVWSDAPARSGSDGGPIDLSMRSARTVACLPDEPRHCYRIQLGQLGVFESVDSQQTWTPAWTASEGRRAFLNRVYPESDPAPSSVDIAVRAVPGGHVVVVANGRDGVLTRTADGTWHRLGFEDGRHLPLMEPGPGLTSLGARMTSEYVLAGLVAILAIGVAAEVLRRRRRLPLPGWSPPVVIAIALTAAATLLCCGFAGLLGWAGSSAVIPLAALVLTAIWVVAVFEAQALAVRRVWGVVGYGLLSGGLFALPLIGWTVAVPDRYDVALGLAVLAAAVPALFGMRYAHRSPVPGPAPAIGPSAKPTTVRPAAPTATQATEPPSAPRATVPPTTQPPEPPAASLATALRPAAPDVAAGRLAGSPDVAQPETAGSGEPGPAA